MTARFAAALCGALLFCAPAFAQSAEPQPAAPVPPPPAPAVPPPAAPAPPPPAAGGFTPRDQCRAQTASLRGTPGYHDAVHQCMKAAAERCRSAGLAAGTPHNALHAYVESCMGPI